MKLTKIQFVNQFPFKANVSKIQHILMKDEEGSKLYEGVEVYRALNVDTRPLYQALRQLQHYWENEVISHTPEYQQAPWG
jgi:hypothetical protein